VQRFGQAYERGDRDPKLLWDYGRLLVSENAEQAIRVFSDLLSQDAGRTDVRVELAGAQLHANQAAAALQTLAPIHTIAPADAPRYFTVAVYAHLHVGDTRSAQETAKHFRDVAKTDEDRAAAERLISLSAVPDLKVVLRPAETRASGPAQTGAAPPPEPADVRPTLRRHEPAPELQSTPGQAPSRPATVRQTPPPPERFSASGRFVGLDCRGKQARMTVETAAGRKVFLVDDPTNVVIVSGTNGPADFVCGPQKTPLKVEVGYEKPPANATVDGVVRTLAF
jgi:hypothetical protein